MRVLHLVGGLVLLGSGLSLHNNYLDLAIFLYVIAGLNILYSVFYNIVPKDSKVAKEEENAESTHL